MEANPFRDEAMWWCCVVGSEMQHCAVQWVTISRPCPVSPGAGYHVDGTMAVVAMSQDGGSQGSPSLVDGEPAHGGVDMGMGRSLAWPHEVFIQLEMQGP